MGSLGAEDFYLIDTLPGVARTDFPTPTNGFDSTQAGCRSSTSIYPPGTKVQCYQDATVGAGGSNVANRGYYTMVYGQYLDYTSGDDISAGAILIPACGSAKARGAVAFTKDVSGGNDFTVCGPVVITCTSIGKSEFGWYVAGGVIPNADLSQLDGTGFLTDGNVVGGCVITSIVAHVDSTEGALLSGPANTDGTYSLLPVGFAWVDDT